MTPHQFWNEEPELVQAYIEADELKYMRENYLAWLQGMYNYNAFSTVIQWFGWSFNGGKGRKPDTYIERPIAITEKEKEAEEKRKADETVKFFEQGQKWKE